MKSDFRKKLETMFNENIDEGSEVEKDDIYRTAATVRNVCFIPQKENPIFLNYAYLISGEYDGENGIIILGFTTHTVTIKGHGLESTYFAFMEHLPRKLIMSEDRYIALVDPKDYAIMDIQIKKNE